MVRLYEGTISAEPEKLVAYGNRAVAIDETLTAEGQKVTASLLAFEAGCTEPGFALNIGHLGDALTNYGQSCIPGDERVRQTGLGFLRADTLATGAVIGTVATVLSPAVIAPALRFASLMNVPSWLRTQIARLPWIGMRKAEDVLDAPNPSKPLISDRPMTTSTVESSQNISNVDKSSVSTKSSLVDVNPSDYTSCVEYAKDRHPELKRGGRIGDASNYIERYKDIRFQISDDDTDLTKRISVGYPLVWGSGIGGAEAPGHVAIIEEVRENEVRISEANWGADREWLSREKLKELWIIPL